MFYIVCFNLVRTGLYAFYVVIFWNCVRVGGQHVVVVVIGRAVQLSINRFVFF